MSRAPVFSALALSVLVSACAPTMMGPPPPPMGPPPSDNGFRADDFSWSAVPGRNSIVGRLGFRNGPTRYTCAGASVILTPETPWTRHRMTTLYASPDRAALPTDEVRKRTPSTPSGDYSAFVRRTTCDAQDRFAFAALPDGAWYVITIAKPAAGAVGPGMALMRRVTTRGGRPTPTDL